MVLGGTPHAHPGLRAVPKRAWACPRVQRRGCLDRGQCRVPECRTSDPSCVPRRPDRASSSSMAHSVRLPSRSPPRQAQARLRQAHVHPHRCCRGGHACRIPRTTHRSAKPPLGEIGNAQLERRGALRTRGRREEGGKAATQHPRSPNPRVALASTWVRAQDARAAADSLSGLSGLSGRHARGGGGGGWARRPAGRSALGCDIPRDFQAPSKMLRHSKTAPQRPAPLARSAPQARRVACALCASACPLPPRLPAEWQGGTLSSQSDF